MKLFFSLFYMVVVWIPDFVLVLVSVLVYRKPMQPEIRYIGYLLTCGGIKPQPKKVEAILGMHPTKNYELQVIEDVLGNGRLLPWYVEAKKPHHCSSQWSSGIKEEEGLEMDRDWTSSLR